MSWIIRKWPLVLMLVVVVVVVGLWRQRECCRPIRVVQCPEHNVHIDLGHGLFVDTIPIAPTTGGIPEYHDCQRVLVNTFENPGERGRFGIRPAGVKDTVTYGPLIALWVAENADKLFPPKIEVPVPDTDTIVGGGGPGGQGPDSTPEDPTAYAIVEIHSWGPELYRPLGIRPGFSCLYLWQDSGAPHGWRAVLVWLDSNPGPCHDPQPASTLDGIPLLVRPVQDPVLSGPDMPPVVRWDRDPSKGHQYIGVRCGPMWCEVGEMAGFESSHRAADEAAGEAYLASFEDQSGVTVDERERNRVIGVKGWYDQQMLAVMQAGKLTPSGVTGTIIPHPALDRDAITSDHFSTWQPAAYIYVDGDYKGKRLQLARGMTQLDLCFNTAALCGISTVPSDCAVGSGPSWWGRLHTGDPSTSKPRCMTFDDTKTAIPAGAARWRWLEDDETTWVRCVQGCCTTQ